MSDHASTPEVGRETQELLRRALHAITNLQAVARRSSPYNKATVEQVKTTVDALAAALEPAGQGGCFVVVKPCSGFRAKCRCGWEQHHAAKFSARRDAIEHELGQPEQSDEKAPPA